MIIVIFLFLRSWRAMLIPLVTIPLSLVGAFALMYMFGFTINTLTLLAMVLAIGLVVDDAIVMLENIYRHVEEGVPPFQAALQGSKEIGFAIIAMTLTLAAVYVPLAFSTGRTGKLFVEFALTLAGAVLVSGFTALTLSPMMCSKLLRHETQHGRFYEFGERQLRRLDNGYRAVLTRALSLQVVGGRPRRGGVRRSPACCSCCCRRNSRRRKTRASSWASASRPKARRSNTPTSTRARWKACCSALPDQQRVFQIVGFPDVTQTIGFVMLEDWEDRKQSAQAIAGSPFPPSGLAAQMFFAIPGVMAFTVTPPPLGQQGFGQPVNFVVQSTGTWEELNTTVQRMMAKMARRIRA